MTAAEVILWGTTIGTVLFNDETGFATFEYDRNFIKSGIELSPIAMPLSERLYTFPELPVNSFRGLPGMLADSLPDKFGNAVIDSWLKSRGRTPESFNAVERLCYTGKRGMGALEFVPALGPAYTENEPVEIDAMVKLAEDILSERENLHIAEGSNAMSQILQAGTSAGGARAKAIVAWNEKTGDIRSGQISAGEDYEYWLIKFDGLENNKDKEENDGPQHTRIEYAYYLMAKAAGISMSECRLYKENGRHHFMTKRFDRIGENGDKLHMQSLGAIAHFDYNSPGAYSYEQAAKAMRKLKTGKEDFSQLYRRMVFNAFALNCDDHVKNISFLMDRRGNWSLSPAYDVTYAYNPGGRWTSSHQMSINGKRSKITKVDLLACAEAMDLKTKEAEAIIRDVA
ncbi:MAG: type II toxin-antitoxin system HipA family toxin, partial [Firmicutes bacterium]|nr:type II toxin-antitoxin system HipA family toxin [Bacillota bacterium]